MRPVQWSEIEGGKVAFEDAFAEVALVCAVKQQRFATHLASLGPPGQAAWDPIRGFVQLRGHHFDAEQVGSFDGESWLWSWANPYLAIPEDKTTVARTLRDRVDVAAFRVAEIAAADERMPHLIAGFALGHTSAAGFYVANASQVYVVDAGSVPGAPLTPSELQAAIRALRAEPIMPFDLPRALRFAARTFGLELEEHEGQLRVLGEVTADVAEGRRQDLAIAFLPRTRLDGLLASLHAAGITELSRSGDEAVASGDGWRVELTCDDRLRAVMSAAAALPARADDAKKKGTVVVVRTECDPSLAGAFVPARGPSITGWVPAQMIRDPAAPVAGAALRIVEAIAALPGALVYDVALRRFYGT